jgi:hypothetical protein
MFTDSHHAASLVSESQQCSADRHEACFQSSRSIISSIPCGPSEEEITVKLLETCVTGRRLLRDITIYTVLFTILFSRFNG